MKPKPILQLILLTSAHVVFCLDADTTTNDFADTLDDDETSANEDVVLANLLQVSNQLMGLLSGTRGAGNPSASNVGSLLSQRRDAGVISADCADHVNILLKALDNKEKWAMRMIDAIGKPPSGLMDMKVTWLGEWEECVQIEADVHNNQSAQSGVLTGQYCSVAIPLSFAQFAGASVTIGVCVPNTCSANDTGQLIELGLSFLPGNITIPEPRVTCKKTKLSLDTRAIVAIIICSLFLAVMTISTVYDAVYLQWFVKLRTNTRSVEEMETNKYTITDLPRETTDDKGVNCEAITTSTDIMRKNPIDVVHSEASDHRKHGSSLAARLLLSFSVFTNGSKLLSTVQGRDSLTAVHGLRFISMTWVMVGHGFSALQTPVIENGFVYGGELTKRREFAAVMNGYFSVDTFFVLSGLLVSYLSLKEMKKIGSAKRFKWGLFYFHRLWRLTPPYMMALMLYVCLLRYAANGPFWRQEGHTGPDCTEGWWKNLLYVNNFVKGEEQPLGCMQWTWYLANDMQFYIISPLMLIPLFYSPVVGGIACLVMLAASMVTTGIISMEYDLPAEQIYDRAKAKTFSWHYYVKPWCRIGPYVVGVFTGYLLYRYKNDIRIPRIVNLLGWAVAFSLGCSIIYGLFSADLTNPFSSPVSALFNATARSAWGACVAWVIFSCAVGYGGPINRFLSWSGFVTLSRLTYFAYLIHPIVMEVYIFSQLQTVHVYTYSMVYTMLGHVCASYAAAFVLSLAFEAPMMGIEKVLLGKTKRS